MMAAPAIDRSGGMRASVLLLVFLSAYFALQAGLRLASASSLNLDDSEMMVITQAFAPGYGSQPPLYNWIQILGTEVLGAGAQANVLIHFLLLWSIFVFMFLAAQIVLGDDLKAAVVALALFTIPQISWESQHSHTHAVLSMAVASLTLYVMLLVLKTGRWAAYLGFGVCLALGILSKYNFIVFALALLISAGSIPALRSRILSPRLAVALALAALLVAPHLNWVWDHLPETLSRTNKFKIRGDAGLFEAWGRGLLATVTATLSFAALSVIVFAAAAFGRLKGKASASGATASKQGLDDGRSFILRLLLVSVIIVLTCVLATRATVVKERWLQPVLLVLPLGLFILLEDRLDRVRQRVLVAVSAGIAIVFMVVLTVVYLAPDLRGTAFRVNAPFGRLAAQIRDLGFENGYVLADRLFVAGNLKLNFPESTVAEPEYGLWPVRPGGQTAPVLLAWVSPTEGPPPRLRALYERLCGHEGLDRVESSRLSALYEHSARLDYTLNVALIRTCPGAAP